MEPNVFLGYPKKGVKHSLSLFRHLNNTLLITYTKKIQHVVFTNYPNEGITFLLSFIRGYTIPLQVSKYMIWNPNYFWDIREEFLHTPPHEDIQLTKLI